MYAYYIIFLLISVLLFSFVLYVKWRQNYWQRLGVSVVKKRNHFFFGHAIKVVKNQISFGEHNIEKYLEIREELPDAKIAGVYLLMNPILIIMDPELIKLITIKDFNHFVDRGLYSHPKDILSCSLFRLQGDPWKQLRAKLTPTFTSGKIKNMFETIVAKTASLESSVNKLAEKNEPCNIKTVAARFTTDLIASCGFGIEVNALEDPENDFTKYGKKVFSPAPLSFWSSRILPINFLSLIGYKGFGEDTENFFINLAKNTIKYREENNVFRNDFLHLLLQLKNQGFVTDGKEIYGKDKTKGSITMDQIIAQCFVFFAAGFETSSTTMTFALYEIAKNQDIQNKLRADINRVLEKFNGKIIYEAIGEMVYLEYVVNETLRKYPPLSALPRICTKDYQIPGTDIVIKKGVAVDIPVWGIHKDPRYYPNPEVFDPYRFTPENVAARPPFTYLPFGEGPRTCIALRFGLVETKVGLLSLIRNFKFTINQKTPSKFEMEKGALIIAVKGNVWLNVEKIVKN